MTASSAIPPVDSYAPDLDVRAPGGSLSKTGTAVFVLGALALAVSFSALLSSDYHVKQQFYFSYLVAYMFTLSLALGALFFVMVQHVARAGWSIVVRRVAEHMSMTLPAMLLLFLPIVFGKDILYHHWMHAELVEGKIGYDPIIAGKSAYLNQTFFFVRAGIYFVVWIGLAAYFRRKSIEQDGNGNPDLSMRLARSAAPGLILFALTITFAAFDWMMSLDPHWFSTMFGVTYFAGSEMAFLAMLALICMFLNRRNLLKKVVNTEHYHDIGKLMFAFMVFWAYVNFSQYFLIQYADIPEETAWFHHRGTAGWKLIGSILVFGHFLVPFAFLLSRHIKRNRAPLALAGAFLVVMHWTDMHFIIMPNHHHDLHLSWLDGTTAIGVLCIFLGLTLRSIAGTNLIPTRDPKLRESLKFQNL